MMPSKFRMNPAVAEGLDYWRAVNKNPTFWATFEAIQFEHELIVRVDVGAYYHRGTAYEFKEIPFKTRVFTVEDGKVRSHDEPHV